MEKLVTVPENISLLHKRNGLPLNLSTEVIDDKSSRVRNLSSINSDLIFTCGLYVPYCGEEIFCSRVDYYLFVKRCGLRDDLLVIRVEKNQLERVGVLSCGSWKVKLDLNYFTCCARPHVEYRKCILIGAKLPVPVQG